MSIEQANSNVKGIEFGKPVLEMEDNSLHESEIEDEYYENSLPQENEKLIPNLNEVPKWIIRVNEPSRVNWDLFVMCLATWNCIWIPFEIAFDPAAANGVIIQVTDYIIDFFFFIDIIITFRTTYIKGSSGDEIMEPKKIAIHYLKNRFIIDLLSIFPFGFIMGSKNVEILNIFGILKVARVLRLGRIINVLNARQEVKLTLKLCNLVFSLILYIHLAGCTWHYIYKDTKDWIPPLDYMFVETDLYDRDTLYQYLIAFYHSVMMLNGNEVGPRSFLQYVFVSAFLMVGAILQSNIFGNMAVLLQEINKKSSRFKEKLDTAKTAVKNLGLPPAFENKVINYLIYTEGNLDKQREFELMNNMISPSLKMQIIRNIFYKIVISNPIFGGGNQDLIEHVLQTISTISFLPEDSIIKQDDDGDKLFFCYQGELEVLIADENSEVNRTNILSPGAMFGEIALISNCKRTATIKCLNYCTCAALTDDQLRDITRKYPEIMSKFKARRSQYNDCWKSFMKKLILTVEYFQKLKPTTIEDLIYSMRQEYIGTNRILYKPGDCIENIRFIVEGSMQVIIQEVVIDHLRQASCLGKYSILEPTPIMFTIKAKDNMKVLYIDYEVLEELRETHPDLDKEMEAYEKYIEEYGLPICDYSIPYKRNVKTKFKNAVRRAITFNAYKHKKKSKLSRLIEDLRKQKKEYEEKGEKKIKREEFKNELADLIYEKIKNIIPNSDDSQAYIMEIFKYINKKMEEVTNTLVEQNDFIGYELGDDESQYHSELDNLEDLENLDLFNDSKEEQKVEKTEGEKINDSFADYFGLGNSHQDQINKAKEQMKEYKLSQSRRKSKKSSHAALDNFLKIDTNEGMSEQSAVLDSERSYPRLTSKEKQEAIDHVRNLNGDHW